MQEGYVKIETVNKIAKISFYHPAHNSLPGHLLKDLADGIKNAGESNNVQVIVLSSAGERTFCAGASFTELSSIKDLKQGHNFFMGFARVINAIRTCGKLVIGRVQGKAVGGGVGLLSAMDYCVATKFASVRLSELAVGIGPFVIGPAVERKVGLSSFSQMAIDPDTWYNAEYAKTKGLYTQIFEDAERMDQYLNDFTHKLSNMNPSALSGLKKVFWEGTEHWDDLLEARARMSGELVLSEYAKNAIGSFLNK